VLLVMTAALGATYRPARTAVAVDPVSALRSD
jgi:ABC-type lipoprotein release transport system permease subunit